MRKLVRILVVLAMVSAAGAAETAYTALQAVQKERGDAVLNQLVEARGESGKSQPQIWTIIMNDPKARGGVREFVISGGAIQSERTPVRGVAARGAMAPISFSRLNLDSDGAFDIANKEARQAKVGFDSVDYTLREDATTGAPIWDVALFDYMGAPVGRLRVSAETGKLVQALRIDPDARGVGSAAGAAGAAVANSRTAPPTVSGPPPAASNPVTAEQPKEPMGGVLGFLQRRVVAGAETVRDTTLRSAGTVQRVLTGRDTVSPDEDETE